MAKTKTPKRLVQFFKIFISDFCTRFGFMNLLSTKQYDNLTSVLRHKSQEAGFQLNINISVLFRLTPLWITTNNFRQINVTKGIIKLEILQIMLSE